MTEHIGTRIAYWRHRRGGLTQAQLAGLAGVSQSYVSQVEAGRKTVDRRSTLVAFANALQVTATDLLGRPDDPADPARDAAQAVVPRIWAAIVDLEEGETRPPSRTLAEVMAVIEQLDGMRSRSEYPSMAPLLPDLLADAGHYRGLALVRATYQTSVCLRNLGRRDLALPPARLTVAAAQELGDPAWLGAAGFAHTITMPYEGAATAAKVAERSIATLQADASRPEVRQMLGQMHLSASMLYAAEQDADSAAAHLAAAATEAETLGDPADGYGFNQSSFGPTNLALWRMSVDVELGEHGRAIETARTFTPEPLRVANRRQSYWMSLGRALAYSGKTDREALTALIRAERIAPAAFALAPMVRDTVITMINRARRRSVTDELRTMARRVGVEVPA